jgi:hypothetical protein
VPNSLFQVGPEQTEQLPKKAPDSGEDKRNNSAANLTPRKVGYYILLPQPLAALVPALGSSGKDSDLDLKAPHPTKTGRHPQTIAEQKRKGNLEKVAQHPIATRTYPFSNPGNNSRALLQKPLQKGQKSGGNFLLALAPTKPAQFLAEVAKQLLIPI